MENLPALNFQLDLLSVELSEKTITENFPGQTNDGEIWVLHCDESHHQFWVILLIAKV